MDLSTKKATKTCFRHAQKSRYIRIRYSDTSLSLLSAGEAGLYHKNNMLYNKCISTLQ